MSIIVQSCVPRPVGEPLIGSKNSYASFTYRNKVYTLGSNVLLPTDTYSFPVHQSKPSKRVIKSKGWAESDPNDEVKYPELYRKSEYIKGSNLDVPKPFQIGT